MWRRMAGDGGLSCVASAACIVAGTRLHVSELFLPTLTRAALSREGAELGETWLVHGCRHREHDFLFRCVSCFPWRGRAGLGLLSHGLLSFYHASDELASFEGDQTLARCCVASSRDGHDHRYVQHYLEHHAEEFARCVARMAAKGQWRGAALAPTLGSLAHFDHGRIMLDEEGYLYVCGNASTMQGELDTAIDNILKKVRVVGTKG